MTCEAPTTSFSSFPYSIFTTNFFSLSPLVFREVFEQGFKKKALNSDMAEVKDPAIKLFGKTIQLPLNDDVSTDLGSERSSEQNLACSNEKNETASDSKLDEDSSSTMLTDPNSKEPARSSTGDNQTAHYPEDNNQCSSPKPSQKEEQSETGSSSQDNNNSNNKLPLKKPDKILPCPRCSSMDTKFCYFNNYNVNQPRHFCKNCQRYWTAGGTMRNVPVGAGRRKSKNSLQHRHLIIPEPANGVLYPSLRPNGSVLAFGSDAPLCESMASALNIAENSNSAKSAEMSATHERQEPTSNNFHGFAAQVPCFPAPPWPSPWNPAQWSPTMPAPPFLPSGYPVSVYPPPPPYWGWTMPLMQRPSGSADHSSTSSSPNSPLGKHSRDGNVLTPKTLRIDDPNEAAKSSIWATLGIKNDKTGDSFNAGGLFRGFKSKGEDAMSSAADTSLVLQANPAALSRSLTFHESAQ